MKPVWRSALNPVNNGGVKTGAPLLSRLPGTQVCPCPAHTSSINHSPLGQPTSCWNRKWAGREVPHWQRETVMSQERERQDCWRGRSGEEEIGRWEFPHTHAQYFYQSASHSHPVSVQWSCCALRGGFLITLSSGSRPDDIINRNTANRPTLTHHTVTGSRFHPESLIQRCKVRGKIPQP